MTGPDVVILAGGRASRLGGGDKGLLPLDDGKTVLGSILHRLGTRRIAINANGDPARFARFGLPVLPDPIEGQPGPLAGVLAAMRWAETEFVVTVPSDAPFVPRDLVEQLVAAREAAGADIAVAASGGRVHPVASLWPARLGPALSRAIVEEGLRKVERWIARYSAVQVVFPRDPVDPFFNVNRPEDLAEAVDLCRRHPGLCGGE
jgi:molybdopterin-guanine dinucleotide biosynthesis protein A